MGSQSTRYWAGTPRLAATVADRTVVHMETTSPEYSHGLAADIKAVGGRYVEVPVSGSRVPAETGDLAAIRAGDDDAIHQVRPVLSSLYRETLLCGPVPPALLMKLAVNIFLITSVTGRAESYHFAQQRLGPAGIPPRHRWRPDGQRHPGSRPPSCSRETSPPRRLSLTS